MNEGRIPPQAIELEEMILGSMLIEQESVDIALTSLREDDLYEPLHREVFKACIECTMAGKSVDLITVGERVDQDISHLTANPCTSGRAEEYCQIIREKSVSRQLIILCAEVQRRAYNDPDAYDVVDYAQQGMFELTNFQQTRLFELHEVIQKVAKSVSKIQQSGQPLGIRTGLDIDYTLQGFQDGKLYIIGARPSMGKDQPLYSKIKTTNGWTTMGDVEVGDEIASIDGGKNIVLNTFPQGIKDVYEITFSDGRSTRCGVGHLWRVYNRKWNEPKVVTTSDLIEYIDKPSYKNRIYIDLVSGDFGKKSEPEIDPWLLGFLIGDGCFKKSSVMFSTDNKESIKRVKKSIPEACSVVHAGKYDYRITTKRGQKNPILDSIRKIGLSGLRSWEKIIPDSLMRADKETRLELLRGLMDSDGWCEKSGSTRYSTSSRVLSVQIQNLVRSLGGLCRIIEKKTSYSYKGQERIGRLHYVCNIRIDSPGILFHVTKKKQRANNSRHVRLNISSINYVGKEETKCIQVSHPSATYITDDYVVTHNTALVMTIMRRLAKDGVSSGILSLETSDESLGVRLISQASSVPAEKIASGRMSHSEMDKFLSACGELSEYGILIDDQAALTPQQIRAKARIMANKGCRIIFIDFLTLIKGSGRSRHEEIGNITKSLKQTAKELNLPVVCLAQLSRKVEERNNKRPLLSDLRESGSIEEDADGILFLYRPEYYGIAIDGSNRPTAGLAEVIVAKNKDGKTGICKLLFQAEYMRFENLTSDQRAADDLYAGVHDDH